LILALGKAPALGQEDDDDVCPMIVDKAITATDALCKDIGRNEICYGNPSLQLETVADYDGNIIENPGERMGIFSIERLSLNPMDIEIPEWGIAVMSLQANLPDTLPGQNVLFIIFGNTELFDITPENETASLPSFYFQTGIGDAPCEAAPDSGVLIRTPEGAGDVTFSMNGVAVTMGSIAYLQAAASANMTVNMLAGEANVSAFGQTATITAGNKVDLPVNANLVATGAPSAVLPHNVDISRLPLALVGVTDTFFSINACEGEVIQAGQRVEIDFGIGRWETVAEANAVLAGQTAAIQVDGHELPVKYVGITLHTRGPDDPGFGDQARAFWIATEGTHTLTAQWTRSSSPGSCTITVE